MSEFETSDSYPTLNKLFTRALKMERKIEDNNRTIIYPVDALVTDFGEIRMEKPIK